MATSGSFSTSAVGNFYFTFEWRRTGYDSSRNEHYIHAVIKTHNTPGSYRTVYDRNLYINGNLFWSDGGGVPMYDDEGLWEGNFTITSYNSAGDGSFSASFDAGVGIYSGSNCSGEGSWDLDRIPRYANFTQHYVSSTGLNSITVYWSADSACDWLQYSLNDGGWIDTSGYPTYTISGLAPNTQYSIRTRIKRTDSQLWTESEYIDGTTKDIARITSAPNINFGDTARIIKTNPSGATNHIRVETLNPTTTIATRTNTSDDMTITFTDEEWDNLYKKLGTENSMTIRYVVDTIQGNNIYYHWVDKTLTLTGNQKTAKVKNSGNWKRGKVWIKVSDTWKRAVVWTKVNGTWERSI